MQSFFNQATLLYNGRTLASNVTRGQIMDLVTITKTPVEDTYTVNGENAYVINIINSGNAALNGLTLTDNLGGYTFTNADGTASTVYPLTYTADSVQYYVNGVQQPAPNASAENGLTFTGINVPAGGNASIVYAASPNEFAPLGGDGTITNTATLTGPGIAVPVSAAADVTALAEPELAILKTLSPQTVSAGGSVTYTFNISNSGANPAVSADNVQVRDTFTPPLSNITVTLDGVTLDPTQYTYNEATGEFAVNPGVITVSAAAFLQNVADGAYSTSPGETVLEVTGTLAQA